MAYGSMAYGSMAYGSSFGADPPRTAWRYSLVLQPGRDEQRISRPVFFLPAPRAAPPM